MSGLFIIININHKCSSGFRVQCFLTYICNKQPMAHEA